MPVYNLPKNPYEDTIDRIPYIGKLINDYVLGRTPEEQLMGAVGMNVNPARKPVQRVLGKKTRADKTLSKILGSEETMQAQDNTAGAYSGLWDKQVRKTISDKNVKFSTDKLSREGVPDYYSNVKGKLGDIIDHPELFEYYPELREFQTSVTTNSHAKKPHTGYITDRDIAVTGHDKDNAMYSLLHEIQHWVQMKEGGWGQGANSERIAPELTRREKWKLDINKKKNPITGVFEAETPVGTFQDYHFDKVAKYLAYWKHAGEAEARDTAEKWLTQKHMGKSWWSDSPLSSQPVDLRDLITKTLDNPKF